MNVLNFLVVWATKNIDGWILYVFSTLDLLFRACAFDLCLSRFALSVSRLMRDWFVCSSFRCFVFCSSCCFPQCCFHLPCPLPMFRFCDCCHTFVRHMCLFLSCSCLFRRLVSPSIRPSIHTNYYYQLFS